MARCTTCSGLWLPAALVGATLGRVALPPGTAAGTSLQCPDDAARLVAVRHRGVEIDVCSACGGVWLDRGELDRVVRQQRTVGVASDRGGGLLHGLDLASGAVEIGGELFGAVLEFVFEALSGL